VLTSTVISNAHSLQAYILETNNTFSKSSLRMPDKIVLLSSALLGGGHSLSAPPPFSLSEKEKKHIQERGDLSSLTSLLCLPISTPPPHNYQLSRDSFNFPLYQPFNSIVESNCRVHTKNLNFQIMILELLKIAFSLFTCIL